MTFAEFDELIQNMKVVWLPETLHIGDNLDVVVKKKFWFLSLVCYLFSVVSGIDNYREVVMETHFVLLSLGMYMYVFDTRWEIPLVTILLLDFAVIHQIHSPLGFIHTCGQYHWECTCMYLIPDGKYPWWPYYFWILLWFTKFTHL